VEEAHEFRKNLSVLIEQGSDGGKSLEIFNELGSTSSKSPLKIFFFDGSCYISRLIKVSMKLKGTKGGSKPFQRPP